MIPLQSVIRDVLTNVFVNISEENSVESRHTSSTRVKHSHVNASIITML